MFGPYQSKDIYIYTNDQWWYNGTIYNVERHGLCYKGYTTANNQIKPTRVEVTNLVPFPLGNVT